ncbi:MAG: hypothetical protein JXR06_03650 [Candidatus Atelocyanobacterium thalassa]|uniref:Uncharacterized protein n=1 Tax=Candidatus Atelocyanobacterium thalassa isolate SIO64986 TaxID=1527444 RepID=A0A086CH05_9CHRO|nr:MAG: hypothetical protein ucyna2_00663 [Candidatus Atelocyanobacterium thalassa isolate SIO64986]
MSRKHIHQRKDTNSYHFEYKWMIIEVVTKLIMNGLLSTIAILSIIRSVNYLKLQQTNLRELQAELQETRQRVSKLAREFGDSFSPNMTYRVMYKQSHFTEPERRRIIYLPDRNDN